MRAKDLELYEQDQLNDLLNLKEKKMNKLKTVDIKGKKYVTVNERIKYFREHFTGYSLTSEITHINESGVIIKAELRDSEGNLLATGMGHEKQGSSFINKTSFIESSLIFCIFVKGGFSFPFKTSFCHVMSLLSS